MFYVSHHIEIFLLLVLNEIRAIRCLMEFLSPGSILSTPTVCNNTNCFCDSSRIKISHLVFHQKAQASSKLYLNSFSFDHDKVIAAELVWITADKPDIPRGREDKQLRFSIPHLTSIPT